MPRDDEVMKEIVTAMHAGPQQSWSVVDLAVYLERPRERVRVAVSDLMVYGRVKKSGQRFELA